MGREQELLMKLTKDESKALAFIAMLLTLSAVARHVIAPAPMKQSLPNQVDLAALAAASEQKMRTNGGGSHARARARGAVADTAIDPNSATVEQLAALPQISQIT